MTWNSPQSEATTTRRTYCRQVGTRPPLIRRIQQIVAQAYGVDENHVTRAFTGRRNAMPRHVAIYLSREIGDYSLPEIGLAFHGMHHTSVLYAHEKIAARVAVDPEFAERIRQWQSVIVKEDDVPRSAEKPSQREMPA